MKTYELTFKVTGKMFQFQAANTLRAWAIVTNIREEHNYQSDIILNYGIEVPKEYVIDNQD